MCVFHLIYVFCFPVFWHLCKYHALIMRVNTSANHMLMKAACMKCWNAADWSKRPLLFYVTWHTRVLIMLYEGLGSTLFISSTYDLKFSEMRVFLSTVWVMNRINWLNWLSWDGIKRSRRRHTYYWWLSFLFVTRWRLRHCWVNTSMPLTNNPRWLEMLLSWQNV